MDQEILWKIIITFLGGNLSVLSPCILPILPGFIAYFSGLSLDQAKASRRKTILASLFFSLGFILVFMLFGIITSGLSQFLLVNQILLGRLGGLIIMIFGFVQIGLIQSPILQKEYQLDNKIIPKNLPTYLSSLLIGILFAFSWTPCYGPIIGAIATYTAVSHTFWLGIFYFIIYSLGFTLPIILLAIFLDRLSQIIKNNQKIFRYSSIFSGILLILIGFLMLFNQLSSIVNFINIIYTEHKLLFF